MLKKVKLYGELGEKFGKEWNLDINSPSEAIRALDVNNPEFRAYMINSEKNNIGYKIIIGNTYIEEKEELYHPSGKQVIKIIPVILGAKKSGLGMILLGAILIMAPFALGLGTLGPTSASLAADVVAGGGMAVGIGGTTAYLTAGGAMMAKFGVALVLSGVSSLLAPTPKTTERPEDHPSYAFDGPAATTRQGVPIPICYGQLIVGGAVISSGIEPEDYEP